MTTQQLAAQLYYCECYVNGHRLDVYDAHGPPEALRSVRISLMIIAITLDEKLYGHTRSWLDDGQSTAARSFEKGKAAHPPLKQRTTAATWTIIAIT